VCVCVCQLVSASVSTKPVNHASPVTASTSAQVFGGTPLKLKGGSTRVRAVAVSEVAWPFWMDAADQVRVLPQW